MTPEQLTLDLSAARTARDDGIASVEANSDEEWKDAVDAVIARLAATGEKFTADNVRAAGVGEPHHPNAWGARFTAARRKGLVERIGFDESARPAGHARAVAVWRGVKV